MNALPIVVIAVGLTTVAIDCRAADLSAPLAPTAPTLGSEIRRGQNAAGQCAIQAGAMEYSDCIEKVSGVESAKIANDEPFRLGLSFHAWSMEDILTQVGSAGTDTSSLAWKLALIEFQSMRALQQKLGVTDDQLIDSSTLKHDYVRERLAYYVKNAPGASDQ